MTRRETIAEAVLASRVLLSRYLVGFDDSNHTRQAPNLPNHVAWVLGHCALTMHRAAERIDNRPLPETDFSRPPSELSRPRAIATARPSGHAAPMRYDTETVAFQSVPVDNPSIYPRYARCVEVFNRACETYAEVLRSLDEPRLDDMVKWGAIEIPIWAVALRMSFHNGAHCGQIADLRRALGMRSIFA